MRFICLFLPAVLAVKQETTEKDNYYRIAVVYSKYCLIINFIMLLLLLFMGRGRIHFDDMRTVNYYILYIFFSFILAQLLPKVFAYCKKNIKIRVKRKSK